MSLVDENARSAAAGLLTPIVPVEPSRDSRALDPALETYCVVLVESDAAFREAVTVKLSGEGFRVRMFVDVPAVLEYLAGGGACDVVLLGWDAPCSDGIAALRGLCQAPGHPPVVVLAARGNELAEERALDSGAVDFLAKGRNPTILAKRLRLLASRTREAERHPVPENLLRCGALTLDLATNRAFWRGRQVPLTITQFRMAALMARGPGRDVSYRELYDVVHGEQFIAGDGEDGYQTNVRSLIRRIRQHFRDVDAAFAEIENYPGFGYRWRGGEVPQE